MSAACPHRDALMRPGALEDGALRAHVASCADCTARAALQQETYAVLRADGAGLDAASRARVWAEVEARRDRGARRSWAWAALIPAAAAIALAVVGTTEPAPPDPRPALVHGTATATEDGAPVPAELVAERWVDVSDGAELALGGARIRETRAARVAPAGPAEHALWLARGAVAVVVDAQIFEVVTPAGRVRARDARYDVALQAGGLEVVVRAGEVEVMTAEASRTLRAGERVVMGGSPRSSAAAAPTPAAAPKASTEAAAPTPSPDATPPARASAPPSARTSPAEPTARALADARHLLGRDDRRAAALADAIVARAPASVEALLIAADARRRQRLAGEAEQLYARAVAHPDGAPFLEEALLRTAELRSSRGDTAGALAALARAQRDARTRFLAPERAALEAQLHLGAGDVAAAAHALEVVSRSADRSLDRLRLDVARALLPLERARARVLLAPLTARADAIAAEARALLGDAP